MKKGEINSPNLEAFLLVVALEEADEIVVGARSITPNVACLLHRWLLQKKNSMTTN
jgi:hypothetical protein